MYSTDMSVIVIICKSCTKCLLVSPQRSVWSPCIFRCIRSGFKKTTDDTAFFISGKKLESKWERTDSGLEIQN